jgi:hypothetical protein
MLIAQSIGIDARFFHFILCHLLDGGLYINNAVLVDIKFKGFIIVCYFYNIIFRFISGRNNGYIIYSVFKKCLEFSLGIGLF